MAEYQGFSWIPATNGGNPSHGFSEYPKNKYIFVKQREKNSHTPTILVNPHFKDNTKVFFNPKFSNSNHSVPTKTTIHINPKVVNPLISVAGPSNSFSRPYSNKLKPDTTTDRSKILLSTKTKFIKLPESKHDFSSATSNKNTTLTSNSYNKSQHISNSMSSMTKNMILPFNPYKTSKHNLNCSINKAAVLPLSPHITSKYNLNSLTNEKRTMLPSNSYKTSKYNLHSMTTNTVTLPSCSYKTSPNLDRNIKNNTRLSKSFCKNLNVKPKININEKILSTRTKIVNASIQNNPKSNFVSRRISINSRFKYISSAAIMRKMIKHTVRSKHKIVNNISNSNRSNVSLTKVMRKRFIYVNKFNSSSFLANNVILKNKKYKNFININGILYQNTPCHLKKYAYSKTQRKSSILPQQMPNNKNEGSERVVSKVRRISLIHKRKLSIGKYGIDRIIIPSLKSMKKCNLPCRTYKRFGKCPGQKNGTCIKIHNPEQIILCPRFLQGTCVKENCLLSHKVSPEKMPTCKYFLEGLCLKDDCQYLHVKISPKADICRDFLEGFCRSGIKCEKRHQLLCPEFEKTGKCPKKRCEYPHTYLKATLGKPIGKKIIRRCAVKKVRSSPEYEEQNKTEKPKIRYYAEEMGNEEKSKENPGVKRPKLGSLPAFIPLNTDVTEKKE